MECHGADIDVGTSQMEIGMNKNIQELIDAARDRAKDFDTEETQVDADLMRRLANELEAVWSDQKPVAEMYRETNPFSGNSWDVMVHYRRVPVGTRLYALPPLGTAPPDEKQPQSCNPQIQHQGCGEPDWSKSKTIPGEGWKNPLLPMNDRLLWADGAIHLRDQQIIKLERKLAPLLDAAEDVCQSLESEHDCVNVLQMERLRKAVDIANSSGKKSEVPA